MISLIIGLVVYGVFCWAVLQVPMAPAIKGIVQALMIIVAILWVSAFFGYAPHFPK